MSMVTITSTNNINHSPLHSRDVSFSSYLNTSESTFIHKLTDSFPNPIPVINTRDEHDDEDEEIGVFGVEKYFKASMDAEPKVQPKTPSVVSESSWNSPSPSFLNPVVKNSPQMKTIDRQKKSFFAGFEFKCLCFDKNSVTIDDSAGEISFKSANSSTKLPIRTGKNLSFTNDAESDESSDLFEIESLGKGNPFLTTFGCLTSTNCYAPSEASIDWSVVTASATDCDDQRSAISARTAKSGLSKEIQRRGPSILLSCKSHKAVRVAGNAYVMNEKVCLNPAMAVRRLQADVKPAGWLWFQTWRRATRFGHKATPPRAFATRFGSFVCSMMSNFFTEVSQFCNLSIFSN